MFSWIKRKSKLQKLQHDYCRLMKNAYKLALKDKNKSDVLHQEAEKILLEIRKIENNLEFEASEIITPDKER